MAGLMHPNNANMKNAFLSLAIASLLLCVPVFAGRGVEPQDYFAVHFVNDPQLSPDGVQVAYVLTTVNEQRNRRESSIWMVAVDGRSEPRRLSAEGFNSTSPRWSPDGSRLAFLSARSVDAAGGEAPKTQILVLAMNGGEAQVVSRVKNGVSSFQWSPDGARFVAVSRKGLSDDVAAGAHKTDTRHYKNIYYKFNDTGWFDDKRTHLWIIEGTTGKDKQITSGEDWNDTDPQWSPDGTRIAFVSDRTGHEYDLGFNKDVWVISRDGDGLTKISDHAFEDNLPRWSPDGKQILFAGKIARKQFPRLYVAPAAGGSSSRLVGADVDTIPQNPRWVGSRIVFQAEAKGQVQLFSVDPVHGTLSNVTSGERSVHNFDINEKAGVIAYLANDFRNMDDIYVADLNAKNERRLTQVNSGMWGDLDLASVERVQYKSIDGWAVDGFLVKPVGWQPGKKYPMILSIHGGPANMYNTGWNQEFQVYAAKGWAVFFTNPRGSTGYGQKFERGILNNWGGMDYQDVMAGVDAVLKQNPWIDSDRLGVTGGSYGGFLTNWILGHTTRFKAAVTLRSISNFVSDEGTRDGAYGHEEDFRGLVFDELDQYWNASPLKFAKNVKTPTLILHSDNDYRVPLEQGEQWFRALKHYGVDAEIVIFPRENHNLTRTGEPKHLVESMGWQVYWFERFLDGNAAAKPPDAP